MSDTPLDDYRPEDFEQMKRIEAALVKAMRPFYANTDPLLGLLALMRIARTLLDTADPKAKVKLLPLIVAFLRGEKRMPSDSPIWIPNDRGPM